MKKLVEKYLADRSEKNRLAIVRYVNKHPMAICTLTHDELSVVIAAGGPQ